MNIEEIKQNIEKKTEQEIKQLFKPNVLSNENLTTQTANIIQKGIEEFENKTGRTMSYGEFREMYG